MAYNPLEDIGYGLERKLDRKPIADYGKALKAELAKKEIRALLDELKRVNDEQISG